jgi:hypothetical protein
MALLKCQRDYMLHVSCFDWRDFVAYPENLKINAYGNASVSSTVSTAKEGLTATFALMAAAYTEFTCDKDCYWDKGFGGISTGVGNPLFQGTYNGQGCKCRLTVNIVGDASTTGYSQFHVYQNGVALSGFYGSKSSIQDFYLNDTHGLPQSVFIGGYDTSAGWIWVDHVVATCGYGETPPAHCNSTAQMNMFLTNISEEE